MIEPNEVRYTIAHTPLGRLLVAVRGQGLGAVALGNSDAALLDDLYERFPDARPEETPGSLCTFTEPLLAYLDGDRTRLDLPLDVSGTTFQRSVWEALRAIPYGETRTYGELAQRIGAPSAVRAVGAACGANPVALVIPCHRAVGSSGRLTGYRWGMERKQRLLEMEHHVRYGPQAEAGSA